MWDLEESLYHPSDGNTEIWRTYRHPEMCFMQLAVADCYKDWPLRSMENVTQIALTHSQSFEETLRSLLGVAERLAELEHTHWGLWVQHMLSMLSEADRARFSTLETPYVELSDAEKAPYLLFAKQALALVAESDCPAIVPCLVSRKR